MEPTAPLFTLSISTAFVAVSVKNYTLSLSWNFLKPFTFALGAWEVTVGPFTLRVITP